MPEEKKVSVIVPVYNVEKYIQRCIYSLVNQTYKNLELIFIDDGSPDSSGDILETAAKDDCRIVVLHKINGGVSSARNTGMQVATGTYICFVDGDDYVEKEFIGRQVDMIETTKTDISVSYNVLNNDNIIENQSFKYSVLSREQVIEDLYLNKVNVAVWNKIYKRDFLQKNGICFNEDYWFAEGMTFNIECFMKTNYIGKGNFALYHQVANSESAVRKFNYASWLCGKRAMEFQGRLLLNQSSKLLRVWKWHLREYNANILYGLYSSGQADFYDDTISECVSGLHKEIWLPFLVNIGIKAQLRSILISIFPVILTKVLVIKEYGYLPLLNNIYLECIMKLALAKGYTINTGITREHCEDYILMFYTQIRNNGIILQVDEKMTNRVIRARKTFKTIDSYERKMCVWGGLMYLVSS